MARDPSILDELARQARRTVDALSSKTSVVHVNLAFLREHGARHLPPEMREALGEADDAATGLVQDVRDLQRLVERLLG